MSGPYQIKKMICDRCYNTFNREIWDPEDAKHPEWRNKDGCLILGSDKYERIKDEFIKKYLPEKICFFFEADCGGDGIAICKEHMEDILDEIIKEMVEDARKG